jgi:hypothetical protein
MGVNTQLGRLEDRSRLAAMAVVTAILVGGATGCRPKKSAPEQAPVLPESAAVSADGAAASEGWAEMEALEPGKWEGIGGAADLEWDAENQLLRIGIGTDLNGVRWTGPMPTVPYEIELEARRMSGSDFFCGLTFPVRAGSESVSLIVGGWGGNLVGISSINGLDASENSTASQQSFEDQRWYRIRVAVEAERLRAWIDDHEVVDAHTEGQELSLRAGPIEECAPLGLATWLTRAEVRGVKWRTLGE